MKLTVSLSLVTLSNFLDCAEELGSKSASWLMYVFNLFLSFFTFLNLVLENEKRVRVYVTLKSLITYIKTKERIIIKYSNVLETDIRLLKDLD